MSYYQRPMGDYKTYGYAGDPGFLSSLWKGIKTVGKALFAPQQVPVVVGTSAIAAAPHLQPPATSFPGVGTYGPTQTFGPSTPAGKAITRGACPPPIGHSGLPVGYHWAKDGSGRCVRNRRMNVANPRALRRAMRRVQGFEKLAKRTITFTRRTRMKK